jgi:hypothetical protein
MSSAPTAGLSESNMLLYNRLGESVRIQEKLAQRYRIIDNVMTAFTNLFGNLGQKLIRALTVLERSVSSLHDTYVQINMPNEFWQNFNSESDARLTNMKDILMEFQVDYGTIWAEQVQPFGDVAEALDSKEAASTMQNMKGTVVSTIAAGPKAALMGKAMEAIMLLVEPFLEFLDPIMMFIKAIGSLLKLWLAPALKIWSQWMADIIGLLFGNSPGIIPGLELMWEVGKKVISAVLYPFVAGFELIGQTFQIIEDAIVNIFGKNSIIRTIWLELVKFLKIPINAVIGGINSVIDSVNQWLPEDWEMGTIPKLATGGLVTGPTFAMIGEGNDDEHVIPDRRLRGYFDHLEYEFAKNIRDQTTSLVRHSRMGWID